jgi:hypothetical protein
MTQRLGVVQTSVSYHLRKLIDKWNAAIAKIEENGGIDYSEIITWAGNEVTEHDIIQIEYFLEQLSLEKQTKK